ncbi:MAG TPA: helix-turn-helix transcriptional regulator [Ramlibacter sp.]
METRSITGISDQPGALNERVALDVADQLDVPLVVLDRRLQLAWANRAARSRRGPIWTVLFQPDARGAAELALRNQLRDLVFAGLRGPGGAEALVEGLDETWFTTAAPLPGDAGLVLLRVAAMRQIPAGVRERLHRLFGLSRAEAQITVQLASGWSLERIAAGRGVSVDTVRAQVRSVFHKTGMHRQGELICAVGTLATN